MRRFFLYAIPSLAALAVIIEPSLVHAAGGFVDIIPSSGQCTCVGSAPDWGCVLQTFQNVLNDFSTFATIFLTIVIAWAGLLYLTSATSAEKRSKANATLVNAVIGLLIVLAAWLLVDTVMKVLYNPSATNWGPWNTILTQGTTGNSYCIKTSNGNLGTIVGQIGSTVSNANGGNLTATGGGMCSASTNAAASGAVQYQNQICADAQAQGIGDQCTNLMAILGQESGGKAAVTSGAGAIGLMQLEPDTAAQYGVGACQGSSRTSPSAACVAALKDPATNIAAGTAYYAALYKQNSGNVQNSIAAYNGGQGVNSPSKDCPGLLKWQCTINAGGLTQTQAYVPSVSAIANTISQQCT